jgi:hypothetical protein
MDFRLDKRKFSITTLQDADHDEARYWRDKTPAERLAALEFLRRTFYGHDRATARLRRVLEIVERDGS